MDSAGTEKIIQKPINIRKRNAYKEFLFILPFLLLVAAFSYFPLFGWVYAFFDYKPPKALFRSEMKTGDGV